MSDMSSDNSSNIATNTATTTDTTGLFLKLCGSLDYKTFLNFCEESRLRGLIKGIRDDAVELYIVFSRSSEKYHNLLCMINTLLVNLHKLEEVIYEEEKITCIVELHSNIINVYELIK